MAAEYWIRTTGLDTNDGLSESAAFLTFAKWITVSADNDIVNVEDGIYPETCIITKSGVTIRGYGANRPILWGFADKTGFADGGSNQWSVAQATDPLNVFFFATTGTYYGVSGTVTKGTEVANKAAVNGAGKWFWDDPTDTLWIFSTSDPATAFGAVRVNSLANGFKATGKTDLTLENVAAWGQAGAAAEFLTASDDLVVRGCHFAFFSEDGVGGSDCLNSLVERNLIEYGGQIFGTIASPGDGVSWHGTSTFLIRKNVIRHMSKAAIDSINVSSGESEENLIYGCYLNLVSFQDAGIHQTFRSNLVILGPLDLGGFTFDDGDNCQLIGNTFYGVLAGASFGGIAVIDPTSTGTLYAYNNVITNFAVAVYNNSAIVTITEDYNSFGGCTASAGGLVPITPSAHDILHGTAILLVNPTGDESGDYGLQSTSPGVNAGTLINPAIGPPFMEPPTVDFKGRTIGSTPDMGAFAFGHYAARHNARLLQMMTDE